MYKIGIQGIKGCFHEMAAAQYFGDDYQAVECKTFHDLANKLLSENADYAVMAIENTLAGSILANYSIIEKNGFFITGETYIPIRMHLMSLPGIRISDIREVISHPVALAQCEDYLLGMKNTELKEFHDTAAAARWVSSQSLKDTAAVASELAAELYGLEILRRDIETHKENFTRFLILQKNKTEVEGRNKASLSLKASHTPGSLADILTIFKENEVNLTKIQSIPIIGKPYKYAFHIDLVWSDYSQYTESLNLIKECGNEVNILGEYVSSSF